MELDWILISSLNGVDLRQNVVYISPFLSSSLSVLLPSSRNTADRSTTNSLLLLLTIILNSSHYPHHMIEKRHPRKRKRSLRLFQRIGRRKFYQQH